jgi:hypothetical protein
MSLKIQLKTRGAQGFAGCTSLLAHLEGLFSREHIILKSLLPDAEPTSTKQA